MLRLCTRRSVKLSLMLHKKKDLQCFRQTLSISEHQTLQQECKRSTNLMVAAVVS